MRTATLLILALLASVAVAQDEDPGKDPAPVLKPVGDRGPDGAWPGVVGPADHHGLPELSDAGRLAYEILSRADRFTDTAVGIAGITPMEVECLRVLHREPAAARAFYALTENGSPAGCVWGLCGLWYWDELRFDRQVAAVLRKYGDTDVSTMRGCIVGKEPLRNIIQAPKGATAVKLRDRTDTCRAWVQRNPKKSPPAYDIAGGGWPCAMRSNGGW